MTLRDIIFSAVLIGLASAVIGMALNALNGDWRGLVLSALIAALAAIVLYFVAADD